MKTHLPQNQFNSAPPVADEAAASSPPLPPDAAAALSVSDGGFLASSPSSETEAAGSVRTAASDISDIPELFRVANLLCVEAREFQPDYPGIYQAMLDPNAPRATDDVWSDLAPLFLQNVKV